MLKIKRFLPALMLMALCFPKIGSGQAKFVKNEWDSLKKFAADERKLIFVDAYTDWCYWCKVMDKNTFKDSAVGAFMNSHFISTRIEMEKEGLGQQLAMKYSIRGFPTFLIFNAEGVLIYRSFGYEQPAVFMTTLKDAVNPEKWDKPKGYSRGFQVDYPEFYRSAFVPTDGKKKYPDSVTVNNYLHGRETILNEAEWAVIKTFNWCLDEKMKEMIFSQKETLVSLYGAAEVDDLLGTLLYMELKKAVGAKDEKDMKRIAAKARETLLKGEDVALRMHITYYLETGYWQMLKTSVNDFMLLNGAAQPGYINEICWTVYEKCDDQDVVAAAVNWSYEALKVEPAYNFMDTYAALLYKNGQLDKAESYAKKAIETGKASGEDVKATKELLKVINKAKKDKTKSK